jgi:hypothetical protein
MKKKLTLDADALRVESFAAGAGGARGTVLGHTDRYTDCWGPCGVNTQDGGMMCGASNTCTDDPLAGDCRSNFYDTRCALTNCDGYSCRDTCGC